MKPSNAGKTLSSLRKTEVVNCQCGETFKRLIHAKNLTPPLCKKCRRVEQTRRHRERKKALQII